jgi:hypothetical protein
MITSIITSPPNSPHGINFNHNQVQFIPICPTHQFHSNHHGFIIASAAITITTMAAIITFNSTVAVINHNPQLQLHNCNSITINHLQQQFIIDMAASPFPQSVTSPSSQSTIHHHHLHRVLYFEHPLPLRTSIMSFTEQP